MVDDKTIIAGTYWPGNPLDGGFLNRINDHKAQGVILFFCVSSRKEFDKLREHAQALLATIREVSERKRVPVILLGTMGCGSQETRIITREGMLSKSPYEIIRCILVVDDCDAQSVTP